jgi:hypothetical protein
MKSPSSSSLVETAVSGRDAAIADFVASIVDGARRHWGERIIAEGNGTFDPRQLYTETHYALAAVLLALRDGRRRDLLDVAEQRLRLWATGTYPLTFFNAMAICLAAIELRQSGIQHAGLTAILDSLIAETREHRHVAYPQWCGNNAYLQQVAIDTVLLPVARGQAVPADARRLLVQELRSFRTPEGLFFDLPRQRDQHDQLMPPTYVLKILFLAGLCDDLDPSSELDDLFAGGVRALLPLFARAGTVSYFGRTDNSPFATGLAIFNLRRTAARHPSLSERALELLERVERFYLTSPRTTAGMLESNRFGDPRDGDERAYSKDAYAYVAQYSLASCAYAMLGTHRYPASPIPAMPRTQTAASEIAESADLGVVRLSRGDAELIVRTRPDLASWDRRYLGPTVLRFSRGDALMVGAIPRTVSTDSAVRRAGAAGGARRILATLIDRHRYGIEQFDAATVGFIPLLRGSAVDLIPCAPSSISASHSTVVTRHRMQGVRLRGLVPASDEALQVVRARMRRLGPRQYVAPPVTAAPLIELTRTVSLTGTGFTIDDRLHGDVDGRDVRFSVRRSDRAHVRIDGLRHLDSFTGWGSDGRQILDVYGASASGREIRYTCELAEAP